MFANHVGFDDHNTTNWSATETAAPVIVRVRCNTVEKNLLIS